MDGEPVVTTEELIELLQSENEDSATAAAEVIAAVVHVIASAAEN